MDIQIFAVKNLIGSSPVRLPTEGNANIAFPTEGRSLKVFIPTVYLGATSPCMGKFRLQTERYCRKNSGAAKTLNSLPRKVTEALI